TDWIRVRSDSGFYRRCRRKPGALPLPHFAGEGWGGGASAQCARRMDRPSPTRRATRVDLPRKRERCSCVRCTKEPAPTQQSLERFSLSGRSIGLTRASSPLAGVLLGKTSLNSLYGLMGGPPQTVPQFWLSRFGRYPGLRRRRMIKIVVFLE